MSESIALWIDVERAAYEVLEGIAEVRDKIQLIHVEVETQEFWKGQRLKADVEDLFKIKAYLINYTEKLLPMKNTDKYREHYQAIVNGASNLAF